MRHRGPTGRAGRRVTGVVRRATRVDASTVSHDYPVDVDANHALALAVELDDGETVRVYEAWPTGGHASSRLARLLDAVGHGTAGPQSLTGERVVLTGEGGDYAVDVDETRALREDAEPAREDTHSLTEVVVAAGVLAGLAGFVAFRTGATVPALALGLTTAVVLALSLGYDAWQTHDATWSPRALPWAVGGLVPVVNVAVAVAYLVRKAAVVDDPESATHVWRDVLVGVVAAFAAGLVLAAFDPTFELGLAVFVHAWVLAPLAVFLDGRTGRHGDSRPNLAAWIAGAVVVGGAGALVYLLRTEPE
ncbi:hypothetical protein [Halobacterium wangiae]|uniref:hypothetical protein n=1 Tax=Halobacterium wangiae TaxID=2902623 RepID=UPI001E429C32|nr:hypothetical protein [Halobacterium wangiae]